MIFSSSSNCFLIHQYKICALWDFYAVDISFNKFLNAKTYHIFFFTNISNFSVVHLSLQGKSYLFRSNLLLSLLPFLSFIRSFFLSLLLSFFLSFTFNFFLFFLSFFLSQTFPSFFTSLSFFLLSFFLSFFISFSFIHLFFLSFFFYFLFFLFLFLSWFFHFFFFFFFVLSFFNYLFMDYGIVVSESELQSHYYIHFRTNTLGKGMKPPYPPGYGLHSTTTVLQGEWLWH